MAFYGLKFGREFMDRAIDLIESLSEGMGVDYDIVASKGAEYIVTPGYVFNRLTPLLQQNNIPYEKVTVRPFSDLPPEEQARRRGLV